MKTLTLIALLATLSGCGLIEKQYNDNARKGVIQLENMGYTDVKTTGWSYFCCDEKDSFSAGFVAKDRQGRATRGCICSGIGKGVTIRFE